MRALQYRTVGAAPEMVDVPTPVPGPGEVLLRITDVGLTPYHPIKQSLPKLALALDVGADHALLPGDDAEAQIRTLTGGKGAAAVFDLVGAHATTGFALPDQIETPS